MFEVSLINFAKFLKWKLLLLGLNYESLTDPHVGSYYRNKTEN